MESHRKATYTEGLYIGEDARLAIALNANYVVQQVKLPTAAMGGISFCHFSEQGASNAIGSVPSRALRAQHWWCSHACGKSSVACAVLSRTEYSCTFSQVWPATTPARPAASANFIIVLGGAVRVLTLCRAARSELRTGRGVPWAVLSPAKAEAMPSSRFSTGQLKPRAGYAALARSPRELTRGRTKQAKCRASSR